MGKDLLLNCIFLKNRVTELGVKQWWLAEQVGVDRKTVIRWLQGRVKAIQPENASALAQVLGCTIQELCRSNEAENLASPEDQRIAAELLVSSSLIEKLGPIGEWNVVESLLKATIVPQLPIHVLGELYNQLTVASWRQSKIDQADLYNQKSLDLAGKCGDKNVLAGALLSKANIHSWRGQTRLAIETYRKCLSLQAFIHPKTLGSIYSNLGAVFYESGDFASGLDYQDKAIENFCIHGKPTNLSIAHCHKAMIYLQVGDVENAALSIDKSIAFALQDDYRRGLQMGKLIRAELSARVGDPAKAEQELSEALAGFHSLGITEGLNFEFAGRVYRILGNLGKAEENIRRGIQLSQGFPVYLAALYQELALTLKGELSRQPEALAAVDKAVELYRVCESPLKVELLKRHFPSNS